MASGSITIDSDSVRALVAKSIIENLTQEQRDGFIQQAIDNILTERPSNGYGTKGDSPLENAFKIAVIKITHDVVDEYVNLPQVRELLTAAVQSYVDGKLTSSEWINASVGAAVGEQVAKALRGDL